MMISVSLVVTSYIYIYYFHMMVLYITLYITPDAASGLVDAYDSYSTVQLRLRGCGLHPEWMNGGRRALW